MTLRIWNIVFLRRLAARTPEQEVPQEWQKPLPRILLGSWESSMSSMTLEEQKKQTLREIEELKLENKLAELEEVRNRLLKQREERLRGKQGVVRHRREKEAFGEME